MRTPKNESYEGTYRITRYRMDKSHSSCDRRVIERGLTIQEARKKLSRHRESETTWYMIELEE